MLSQTLYGSWRWLEGDGLPETHYIGYEIDVPIEYWRPGADLIPENAQGRVRQMEMWRRLYDGDWSDFPLMMPIRVPYHARSAILTAQIMLAYAPEYSEMVTAVLGRAFLRALSRSLFNVIVDTIRYGTGLYRIAWDSLNRIRVHSIEPVYWYPAGAETDALVTRRPESGGLGRERVTWVASLGQGVMALREFLTISSRIDTAGIPTVVRYGTPAHWQIVDDVTDGRDGLLITVSRPPDTGDWGRGVYGDITSLVMESNIRLSENSGGLTEQANAAVVFEKEQGNALGDRAGARKNGNNDDANERRDKLLQSSLNTWRQQRIKYLPPGAVNAQFLELLAQFGDSFDQIKLVEQSIMAAIGLPPEWFSMLRDGFAPSGTALKRQHVPTHSYIKQLQAAHIAAMKRVVLTACAANLIDLGRLNAIAQDPDAIIWKNIFDAEEMDDEADVDDPSADPLGAPA